MSVPSAAALEVKGDSKRESPSKSPSLFSLTCDLHDDFHDDMEMAITNRRKPQLMNNYVSELRLSNNHKKRKRAKAEPLKLSKYHDCAELDMRRRQVPIVKAIIADQNQTVPKNKQNDPHAMLAFWKPRWNNLLKDFFHMYDVDDFNVPRCSIECRRQDTIIEVHEPSFLHGCWKHGYLHVCEIDFAKCHLRFNNTDNSINCVLSGRFMGFEQGDDISIRNGGSGGKNMYDWYASVARMNKSRDQGLNAAQSDMAIIARITGGKHLAIEAPPPPPPSDKENEEQSSNSSSYEKMVPKGVRELAAQLESEKTPKDAAAADTSQSSNSVNSLRRATDEDVKRIKLQEKQDKTRKRLHRQSALRQSSRANSLSEQAMRVGRMQMRTVILEVLQDLLLNSANRGLYNRFMRMCLVQKAQADVRLAHQAARKRRVLMLHTDVITILEHYNAQYEELIPRIEYSTEQQERIVQRVSWLWEKCCDSPYARERKRYDDTSKKYVLTPTNDDICSLRQFALACLYYFRDGLTIAVPGTGNAETVSLLRQEESLIFELPSEKHVHYFGMEARQELHRLLSAGLHNEADFDFKKNVAEVKNDKVAQNKPETSAGGRRSRRSTRANSVSNRSAALVRSESMDVSFGQLQKQRGKRKTIAKRTALSELARGERNDSVRNARVTVGSDLCAGISFTEQQLVPSHMHEPMLTGGSRTTKRGCYNTFDLIRGRKMINTTLNSYGHKLTSLAGF